MFRYYYPEKNDEELLFILNNDTDPSNLTFAAEEVGVRGIKPELVVDRLIELLNHPRPVAREGAVYGLSYYLDYKNVNVRQYLIDLMNKETTIMKTVIKDILY